MLSASAVCTSVVCIIARRKATFLIGLSRCDAFCEYMAPKCMRCLQHSSERRSTYVWEMTGSVTGSSQGDLGAFARGSQHDKGAVTNPSASS